MPPPERDEDAPASSYEPDWFGQKAKRRANRYIVRDWVISLAILAVPLAIAASICSRPLIDVLVAVNAPMTAVPLLIPTVPPLPTLAPLPTERLTPLPTAAPITATPGDPPLIYRTYALEKRLEGANTLSLGRQLSGPSPQLPITGLVFARTTSTLQHTWADRLTPVFPPNQPECPLFSQLYTQEKLVSDPAQGYPTGLIRVKRAVGLENGHQFLIVEIGHGDRCQNRSQAVAHWPSGGIISFESLRLDDLVATDDARLFVSVSGYAGDGLQPRLIELKWGVDGFSQVGEYGFEQGNTRYSALALNRSEDALFGISQSPTDCLVFKFPLYTPEKNAGATPTVVASVSVIHRLALNGACLDQLTITHNGEQWGMIRNGKTLYRLERGNLEQFELPLNRLTWLTSVGNQLYVVSAEPLRQ
jgi:hypothetical protein